MRCLGSFVIIAVAVAAPVSATSWGYPDDHKVENAVCEAKKLADYVNNMWADYNDRAEGEDRFVTWDNFDIYTDRYGKIGSRTSQGRNGQVLPSHQYDFVEDLRMSFGKEDEGPIVAHRLVRLTKHKRGGVYLLQLRRNQWQEFQLLPDFESWAGYQEMDSTWILEFEGNEINLLREADELAPLAEKGRDLFARTVVDCQRLEREREDD